MSGALQIDAMSTADDCGMERLQPADDLIRNALAAFPGVQPGNRRLIDARSTFDLHLGEAGPHELGYEQLCVHALKNMAFALVAQAQAVAKALVEKITIAL